MSSSFWLPLAFIFFLKIIDISILCFSKRGPYLRFQYSSKYGEIQRQIAQCTWKTCWKIRHLHIYWIMLSLLIVWRKTLLHQRWKFEKNMNRDFFRDLEPWRRRHQVRRNWKGVKGGEKYNFKSLDLKCKTRKVFPFNPIKK